jgi:hypothetical protein
VVAQLRRARNGDCFAKQSPQDERRRREQALVPEIKYVLNKVQ